MQGSPLVTVWPLPAHVHRTVSPTEMLTVSGSNAKPGPTDTSTIWAGARWHAAHGRSAVLIDYADDMSSVVFLWRCVDMLVARFSLRQKSNHKQRRQQTSKSYACI